MRPVLDAHSDGQPLHTSEVRDRVAAQLGITDDDRKIMLPSGKAPVTPIGWPGLSPISLRPPCWTVQAEESPSSPSEGA